MVRIIHQNVIVQPGGVIEIRRADLPDGANARVTVSVDAPDTLPPTMTSLMGSCPPAYESAGEVDAHIQALRDEMDRPWPSRN